MGGGRVLNAGWWGIFTLIYSDLLPFLTDEELLLPFLTDDDFNFYERPQMAQTAQIKQTNP